MNEVHLRTFEWSRRVNILSIIHSPSWRQRKQKGSIMNVAAAYYSVKLDNIYEEMSSSFFEQPMLGGFVLGSRRNFLPFAEFQQGQ